MSNDSSALDSLQQKLAKLETALSDLLSTTESDVAVAKQLQKHFQRNRLAEIPGVECHARYISAAQLSSDFFDIIPSTNRRHIWFFSGWTESFGLSSVLMQVLIHFRAQEQIQKGADDQDVMQVFNDLSMALADAKKKGSFRLGVAKLNVHDLRFSGVSFGQLPFVMRSFEKAGWTAPQLGQKEIYRQNEFAQSPASSAAPPTADRAHAFDWILRPGSRLFYVSPTFLDSAEPDLLENLLEKQNWPENQSLMEDLNSILMLAEDKAKAMQNDVDITGIALEIDQKKLHLA